MAINPSLLVAAPMLQDYIVDKDLGTPLANGIVTLYQDTQRQIFKNWYYQTGSPGAYTYVPLDNPLRLSSVGTIQDPNGNDVIPFYYPFDENNNNIPQAYYITVYSVDSDGNPATLQFTRENFPFEPTAQPNVQNPTFRNYILNNVFWRNIGSLAATNVLQQVVAPSQHEGYTNGDIQFIKNVTGGADTITFSPMSTTLTNDITPEQYMNVMCTNNQVGETTKCIQYPLSLHVRTLQNAQGTIVVNAQNVGGGVNNYIDVQVYQFLGTGALVQPNPITVQRIILNSGFTKFLIPVTLPDASNPGVILGNGGDDALFIRLQYPLSLPFNINHTKVQFYLSNTVPDNDFDTYDQVEYCINSPRTGDYRTSLNSFQPFGYVPCNDGTIGSALSSATTRANIDTWPLYNLLWNNVLNIWAPVSGGRGASAIADFTSNKAIALTRQLGRVMQGANGAMGSSTFTASSLTSILTLATALNLTTGTPIQFTNTGGALPSPLAAGVVYYVSSSNLTASTISVATTLDSAYAGGVISLSTNGSGTNTVYSAVGAYIGESAHTMVVGELVGHTHPTPGGLGQFLLTGTGTSPAGTMANSANAVSTTGNNNPNPPAAFNVLQPTMNANVFLKL